MATASPWRSADTSKQVSQSSEKERGYPLPPIVIYYDNGYYRTTRVFKGVENNELSTFRRNFRFRDTRTNRYSGYLACTIWWQ